MSAMVDLTGRSFGKLSVIRAVGKTHKTKTGYSDFLWECKCDCGNTIITTKTALLYHGKNIAGA